MDPLPAIRWPSTPNGGFDRFATPGSDPQRPIRFLQTGQSAKSRFCELECSEAAIGDLNLPARNGRWRSLPKAVIEAAWVYAIELKRETGNFSIYLVLCSILNCLECLTHLGNRYGFSSVAHQSSKSHSDIIALAEAVSAYGFLGNSCDG